MNPKHNNINFPLWQYLNQPLFSRQKQLILNPRRFATLWRIQLLERCWTKQCDAKGPQQN